MDNEGWSSGEGFVLGRRILDWIYMCVFLAALVISGHTQEEDIMGEGVRKEPQVRITQDLTPLVPSFAPLRSSRTFYYNSQQAAPVSTVTEYCYCLRTGSFFHPPHLTQCLLNEWLNKWSLKQGPLGNNWRICKCYLGEDVAQGTQKGLTYGNRENTIVSMLEENYFSSTLMEWAIWCSSENMYTETGDSLPGPGNWMAS